MKRDVKLLPIDKVSTITLLLDTLLLATMSFSSSGDRLAMVVGVVDDLRTEAASTTLLAPGSQNGRPADTTTLNAMMTQSSNSSSIFITRIARQLLLDAIPTVAIHFIISCGSWARLEASKLSTGATVKLKVKTERTLEIMGIAVQFGIIMIFAFGNWARNEKSSYGTTFGLALVQYVEYNTHQEPNFTGRAVGNNCS